MTLAPPRPERTRVYIAGPISGIHDDNRVMFETVEKHLLRQGFAEVVNPLALEHNLRAAEEGFAYTDFIRYDFRDGIIARRCNAIVLLPGWPFSRGALNAELPYFANQGYPVGFYDDRTARVTWMHVAAGAL